MGSEYRTSLVFESSKQGADTIGPIFEWFLNTGPILKLLQTLWDFFWMLTWILDQNIQNLIGRLCHVTFTIQIPSTKISRFGINPDFGHVVYISSGTVWIQNRTSKYQTFKSLVANGSRMWFRLETRLNGQTPLNPEGHSGYSGFFPLYHR